MPRIYYNYLITLTLYHRITKKYIFISVTLLVQSLRLIVSSYCYVFRNKKDLMKRRVFIFLYIY